MSETYLSIMLSVFTYLFLFSKYRANERKIAQEYENPSRGKKFIFILIYSRAARDTEGIAPKCFRK